VRYVLDDDDRTRRVGQLLFPLTMWLLVIVTTEVTVPSWLLTA
jgi:hypothetical protein